MKDVFARLSVGFQNSVYSPTLTCEVFEVEPALSAPKNASGVTDWYRSSS